MWKILEAPLAFIVKPFPSIIILSAENSLPAVSIKYCKIISNKIVSFNNTIIKHDIDPIIDDIISEDIIDSNEVIYDEIININKFINLID